MALGGDLSKIDLTAIFQTLALNQQVGTLVVTEKDSGRKTSLYFDQNTVALVASDKRNYFRLGQILMNRGIISDEVLRRALEQQKRTGGLLGEVLCDLGVVTPEEIEEVVYANGGVETAAAIGAAHPQLGQAIVVIARPLPGSTIDEQAIVAACRKALPGYMVPSRVILTDEMLQNPNGKIDRNQLARQYAGLFDNPSDSA